MTEQRQGCLPKPMKSVMKPVWWALALTLVLPTVSFGGVIPGQQADLDATLEHAAYVEHIPIKVQIVQTSPVLVIDAAIAVWKGYPGAEWRPTNDHKAYWQIVVWGHNEGAQPIVASEFRTVLLSAFGDKLENAVGVLNESVPPIDKAILNVPTVTHAPGMFAAIFERVAMSGDDTATSIKVSVSRVKFADGSVWAAK